MKEFTASWECPHLEKRVSSTVVATNKEHAFSKVLADTLVQLSLLYFIEDKGRELDSSCEDLLDWEEKDVAG